MRGQQALFSDILPPIISIKNSGIGRNKVLHQNRNNKLIHRYYWYAQLQPQRLDYSYIINQLSNEFDLSDFRIIIVIQENHAQLKQVFASKPSAKELQKMFPHLSWQ
ncbi:MAG: hypothetical protein IPP48_03290 [Chitinophagaceae bacterium]|nr:hypothetical protein [Chitinophagaceae bacterium]